MIIELKCHCGAIIEVEFTFGEDAQTLGRPEHCHDGSAPDCNPDKCPECGCELDQADIEEKAAEIAADAATERAIQRHEDRMEERFL